MAILAILGQLIVTTIPHMSDIARFPSREIERTQDPLRRRQNRSRTDNSRPAVLFVRVHNAGRSQTAAGYLRALAGDGIDVFSAGSQPGNTVNPAAVTVMDEEGIDLSAATPQILTTDAVRQADVVITMGCGDTCLMFPGSGGVLGPTSEIGLVFYSNNPSRPRCEIAAWMVHTRSLKTGGL
jgi:arsenate reductase